MGGPFEQGKDPGVVAKVISYAFVSLQFCLGRKEGKAADRHSPAVDGTESHQLKIAVEQGKEGFGQDDCVQKKIVTKIIEKRLKLGLLEELDCCVDFRLGRPLPREA